MPLDTGEDPARNNNSLQEHGWTRHSRCRIAGSGQSPTDQRGLYCVVVPRAGSEGVGMTGSSSCCSTPVCCCRRSSGSSSRRRSSCCRCAAICDSGSRTATSRNSSPNAASRSITFDAPRVVWRPRNIHHVRTPRRCTRTARWISTGSVAALNRPRPGEYARRTFGEERRSDPSGRERRS